MTVTTPTVELARAERADLLALLGTLTPEQWATPSLCVGWNVHEVVAHALSYDELGAADLLRRFAHGRFWFDGANAAGVEDYRDRSPEQLLDLLRSHLTPSGLTAAFGSRIGLADALIHQQDIRRPLGLPRTIPDERLLVVLDFAMWAPPIRGALRARRVRLEATDLDWGRGRGALARGPAEALLMVAAGRRGVTGELSGPGSEVLARRVDAAA